LTAPVTGLNCASMPRTCPWLMGEGPKLCQSAIPLTVATSSSRRSSGSARQDKRDVRER
jgi:hypothetical protein